MSLPFASRVSDKALLVSEQSGSQYANERPPNLYWTVLVAGCFINADRILTWFRPTILLA